MTIEMRGQGQEEDRQEGHVTGVRDPGIEGIGHGTENTHEIEAISGIDQGNDPATEEVGPATEEVDPATEEVDLVTEEEGLRIDETGLKIGDQEVEIENLEIDQERENQVEKGPETGNLEVEKNQGKGNLEAGTKDEAEGVVLLGVVIAVVIVTRCKWL